MTPEDAWRDNRAACEIKCREARDDERRRIIAYLRSLGGWGAVAAAAIEGDDYWKRERSELVRGRRVSHSAHSAPNVNDEQQAPDNSHAPDATDHTSTSSDGA